MNWECFCLYRNKKETFIIQLEKNAVHMDKSLLWWGCKACYKAGKENPFNTGKLFFKAEEPEKMWAFFKVYGVPRQMQL